MAKSSGGTRNKTPEFSMSGGSGRAEFTDLPNDFFLPSKTRAKLPVINQIETYNDLKAYFEKKGVKLMTEELRLVDEFGDTPLEVIQKTGRQIATAYEAYKNTFGADAVKSLKGIILFSKDIEGQAAYSAILKGEEDDGKGGYLKIKNLFVDGHDILHEFAHVYQDSKKKRGEDLLDASARMNKSAMLPSQRKAYFGANKSHVEAERMAESLADAFYKGTKEDIDFVKRLRKLK